jgi:hypothetical protein
MDEEMKPSDGGEVCPVTPIYRVGDTVVFKYEGNIRALVEGYELLDGKVRLRCRAEISFLVSASHVVGVERESED